MTVLPFDFVSIAEKLEGANPAVARLVAMKVMGFVSPFNRHLKMKLTDWTKTSATAELKCHRGVKNHLGGIHAGALFTLGESVAGLLIVKNFSFKEYRPIMTEIAVHYEKQARGPVYGTCKSTQVVLKKILNGLSRGPQLLPMETRIFDMNGALIARVKTIWQIKPWSQVKKK